MAASRELENIVRQMLQTRSGVARFRLLQDARSGLAAIRERDYEQGIKAQFSPSELHGALAQFALSIPGLNRRKLRGTSTRHLHRTANRLGTDLQIGPVLQREAEGLRGFYARAGESLKRPLIWLNRAQHHLALAASFWHEVGHHLSTMLGERECAATIWSFDAEYSEHLDDPLEILADMLVCLAAYPKPIAKALFAGVPSTDRDSEADTLISISRARMRETGGFDFTPDRPLSENLGYLAGMLHFAKMRVALLRGYDI